MSFPFDAVLKEIIGSHLADFVAAFALPAVSPINAINVDLSTLSAATDVAIGFGDPPQEVVDLNFQSGPDPNLAARLLVYNAALFLKCKAPVRSILVLLRPRADAAGIDGRLTYAAGGKRVEFEYDVVRLWLQPPDRFLSGGTALLPLATLCSFPKDRPLAEILREVVRKIDQRLAGESDPALAARLMTAAFILAGMRVEKHELSAIFDGVKIMHESTAYDVILDEGRAEGLLKGRVEGFLSVLIKLGRKQFGAPTRPIEVALAEIRDPARLDRMVDALSTAKTWDELLSTP